MKKIAIIGGGAAGMVAAITAAASGTSVEVFEQNDRVGKKILASGNGRCNITNTHLGRGDYFGADSSFVDYALGQFGFIRFQKFCKSIGLLLDVKEDGRAYPLSNEAKSVVSALEAYARTLGVVFRCEAAVKKLEKEGDTFCIHTGESCLKGYDKVLVCTGSEAAPQLGGNGDGYAFAESFGHTVEPAYPSLVALELDSAIHHKMAGAKHAAVVTLYIDGKAEQTVEGDILFTRYGISGFAILDISQAAAVALMRFSRVEVGLKLLGGYERQSLGTQISQLCKTLPEYPIETLLGGLIPSKPARYVLETCKIAADTPARELSTKAIKKIASTMCDWRFSVSATHGFKHAEVSGGGVSTNEVDEKTMESKKVKGLYFAGEVLDIVGRRGGYNLHFAWASGYAAGKNLGS